MCPINNNKFKHMKSFTKNIIIILLSSFTLIIHSQENFTSAGTNILNSEGSISFSIGQIFYETNTDTSSFEIQGLQQPLEFNILQINEINDFNATVYPNPTTDILYISSIDNENKLVKYTLSTIEGKVLEEKTIENEHLIQIDLKNYNLPLVLLRIENKDLSTNSFIIIKK